MLAFDRRLDWIQLKYLMVPFTLKYSKDTALKQLTTWGGAQVHRRHQYGKKKKSRMWSGNREVAAGICLPGFESWLHHLPASLYGALLPSFVKWGRSDSNQHSQAFSKGLGTQGWGLILLWEREKHTLGGAWGFCPQVVWLGMESGEEAGKTSGSRALETCCEGQAPLMVYLLLPILRLAWVSLWTSHPKQILINPS